jgi:hypothetical protein
MAFRPLDPKSILGAERQWPALAAQCFRGLEAMLLVAAVCRTFASDLLRRRTKGE